MRDEDLRVALPGQDGVQDGQAGDAGEVAEDVVEREVHLGEGRLHVLGVRAGQLHKGVPMPEEAPHGADRLGGPEGGAQEADRVEGLEPLAVLHVGFPTRHVLHVARVDQADLDPPRLEDLVQGNPGHPGGLPGDRGDATAVEPGRQGVQILGERREVSNRRGVPIEGDTDVDRGGANVDPRCVRVHDGWRRGLQRAAA